MNMELNERELEQISGGNDSVKDAFGLLARLLRLLGRYR